MHSGNEIIRYSNVLKTNYIFVSVRTGLNVNVYVQRLVLLVLEPEARARHLQQGNWKTTQEKGKRNASKRFGHSLPTLESPPTEASSCYRFEYFCKSVLYGAATERRKS